MKSQIYPRYLTIISGIYIVFEYIDQSQDLDGWAAKYKYIGIVRGQLSRYELVWLYFNSLFYPKMKGLIEKYAVLKNLRPEYLAQDFDLGKKWYAKTAFDADRAREVALQREE